MGFQDPRPGYPQPDFDTALARQFIGASFAVDHIVVSGAPAWLQYTDVGGADTWSLSHVSVYAMTHDTFAVLQVAQSQADGSFVTTTAVTYADGTVIASGTAGRLQAQVIGGVRVAVPVSIARPGMRRGSRRVVDSTAGVADGSAAPSMAT